MFVFVASLNLICQGTAAVDHTTTSITPYGIVSTDGRAPFDDTVGIRLAADGTGEARLPRRMLPTVKTSNDGGWFPLIHVEQSADAIDAQIRLNQYNKPRVRIDRIAGTVRIDGALKGRCFTCSAVGPRRS
jgi:hypothetical protein